MEPKTEPVITIGQAAIISYEMTFNKVSYVIGVQKCVQDSGQQVISIPDFQIQASLALHPKQNLLTFFKNPAFIAMQQAWENQEEDCYFEHRSNDHAAFMILNGVAALIPVVNTNFPA